MLATTGVLHVVTVQLTHGVKVSTMAQVLEQPVNDRLLVHPDSVFLVVYPGGFCGEFLTWWLGLHPGCIQTDVTGLDRNRYVWKHRNTYVFDESGSRDRLFLTGHRSDQPSKCGLQVNNISQHIGLCADSKHYYFFFYLFLIKTIFHPFSLSKIKSDFFVTDQRRQEFLQYLNGRTMFTGGEYEAWAEGQSIEVADIVQFHLDRLLRSAPITIEKKCNISNLFFGDTAAEYTKLCDTLQLSMYKKIYYYLPQYHRRNVDLVEQYSGMTIDEFLAADHNTLVNVMIRTGQQLQSLV